MLSEIGVRQSGQTKAPSLVRSFWSWLVGSGMWGRRVAHWGRNWHSYLAVVNVDEVLRSVDVRSPIQRDVPTLTVSVAALEQLGVRLDDVEVLDPDAKRSLEGLLLSRGFSMRAAIHVTRLPADAGFILTQ